MSGKPNPMFDPLAYQAYPELAAALRERSERILERWEQLVRALLPNAERLTLQQMRNSIPEALAAVADALASEQPADTQLLQEITRDHGAMRFHQEYNVRELITEYHLLRRVAIEELAPALGHPQIDFQKLFALETGLDVVMRQGTTAFTEYQATELRTAAETHAKFLSFLSHDLRNRLNHITLVLDLLNRRLCGVPEFAEDAADLLQIQRTILETIEGMERFLQAERMRRGQVKPVIAPVQLHELVATVVEHFAIRAQEKGLTLISQVPAGLTLQTDQQLLTIVLHNLIGNATKYASSGTICVAATAAADHFRLWVTDQGPGIAPDQLQSLFHAFVRGATQGQPGVGLGLAIASEAATLLSGRLGVESTPGCGSTFWLEVPTPPTAAPPATGTV